jgi:hypothetical protein
LLEFMSITNINVTHFSVGAEHRPSRPYKAFYTN